LLGTAIAGLARGLKTKRQTAGAVPVFLWPQPCYTYPHT